MLDDLKYIHERDQQDALGIAEKQWQQLSYEFNLEIEPFTPKNIVFSGMGGSALAALLSTTWPSCNIPFEICRNYEIPKYVSNETLFISSSYSGNTEETLSALKEAQNKNAFIAVISSGGQLKETAQTNKYPILLLPPNLQPRMATLYSFKALITLLFKLNIISDLSELENTSKFIEESVKSWRPDVPSSQNQAKKIALDLVGKTPVIYSGSVLAPAAYKWKINFNENAKNVAWWNQYPEFNHNEFLGWSSHPVDKPYAIIDLRSDYDNPQIKKRFDVSNKLLSGKRPEPITVLAKGDNVLEQLVYMVVLGDFVSLYLALLNGLNPTPVDLIEKLKTNLS